MQIRTDNYNLFTNSQSTRVPSFGIIPPNGRHVFEHSDSRKLIKKLNIFEKALDLIAEAIARIFGIFASLKPVQKVVTALKRTKNYMQYLMAGVSVMLTAFTIGNINKSKKIEQDQKLNLILNQIGTTIVTVGGGFLVDNFLNKKYEKFVRTFMQVNKDLITKKSGINWLDGLKHAKTFVVFGFIYRYFGPVFVTPFANKLSTIISEYRKSKATERIKHEQADKVDTKHSYKVA